MGGTTGQPTSTPTTTASTSTAPSSMPTWASSMISSAAPNLSFPSSPIAAPTSAGASLAPAVGAGNTAAGFQNAPLTTSGELPHIGGQAPAAADQAPVATVTSAAAATPATDPNAQVFVYTQPSWGYGSPGPNRAGFNDAGVYSATGPVPDPNNTSFGAGWGPYASIATDPYNSNSVTEAGQKAAAGLKAGDVLTPAQLNTLPHMSKSLYDSNMAAYGNPYGPAVDIKNRDYYNHLLQLNGLGGWADMQQHGSG
jgi:hypothetical protein